MLKWKEFHGSIQTTVRYLDKDFILRITQTESSTGSLHEMIVLQMLTEIGWATLMLKVLPLLPQHNEILGEVEYLQRFAQDLFVEERSEAHV